MATKKKKKKKNTIFVSNEDVGVPEWVPSIKKNNNKSIDTNSWFKMNFNKNPNQIKLTKRKIIFPTIPKESYKQQKATINRTKSGKTPGFIYTIKNRIYPTISQQLVLQEWFNAFIKMYNITVNFVNHGMYINKKIDLTIASKLCNFILLRELLYEEKEKIKQSLKYTIYTHLLDEAIKHAVSNFKGCITKFEKGNIKKFRVREMSYNKSRKILIIEPSFFGKSNSFHETLGTIFSTIFGKETMESEYSLEGINKTTTLQFNTHTKKYILLVPKIMEPNEKLINKIDCGGDGGGRTFFTFYSKNGTHSIGTNMNSELKPIHKKIERIQKKLYPKKEPINDNPIGNISMEDKMAKRKKKRKLKKALEKHRTFLKNKVKDMHYKVAYFLVNNFDNIYIGKLNTSQILRKSNKLPKNAKKIIKSLKHYAFRSILSHMGHKYGATVYLVSEYLTTQTCSNCGVLNHVGDSEIFHCKSCKMKTGRDENSAKNHLKIGYEDGTYIYNNRICKKVKLLTEINGI